MSESEDTTIDILERCISQSEKSIWRCVKSSRESGEDKNELGCGIRPKMNVSDVSEIQRAPSSQQLRH